MLLQDNQLLYGMYNMCGNVAEMIEEKGIAKGGSFIDPAYKVRIASEKHILNHKQILAFVLQCKSLKNKSAYNRVDGLTACKR
jgi:hypothetical protein